MLLSMNLKVSYHLEYFENIDFIIKDGKNLNFKESVSVIKNPTHGF